MKQAVVLIHGIGEQQPMGTIRPFARAVLGGETDEPRYYSKPDAMSELFELRRLQAAKGPSTHFYEYYWAYNVEGTKALDTLVWLGRLLVKRKRNVPESARGLWRVSRLLAAAALLALALGWFGSLRDWYQGQPVFGLVWFTFMGAILLVQYALVSFLGDAARYLSPRPRNIKLRQKIRADGIKLLRTLHESGDYDRVILVGHSLGSVIGYDLITHLWQEYNESLPKLGKDEKVNDFVRSRMRAERSAQPTVRNRLSASGESLGDASDREEALGEFRRFQRDGWREQRYYGNRWLISDFVTLGSPLAHAMLLLAKDADDFKERKRERELVTCPPQRDQKGYAYSAPYACNVGPPGQEASKKFTPLILHHAAPFAVTRWSNLYFPLRLAFLGDVVGGELKDALGSGILDVPVYTNRWKGLVNLTPLSHTSYWLPDDAEADRTRDGRLPALHALNRALALGELRRFRPGEPASND